MKKLFAKRTTAIAILIIVALLAVPLLGGLKLSLAVSSAEKKFGKAVSGSDKYSLTSDVARVIDSSSALLAEGERLAGSGASSYQKQAMEALGAAIERCSSATADSAKYSECIALIDKANSVYSSLGSLTSSKLDELFASINSDKARVYRTYKQAYAEYSDAKAKLISGFPASQIAKLFNIGG